MADLIAMQVGVLAVLTFTILFYYQGLAAIDSRVQSMRPTKTPGSSGDPAEDYLKERFPGTKDDAWKRRTWRAVTYLLLAGVAIVDLALWVVAAIQVPWTAHLELAWLKPRAAGIGGAAYTFLVALTLLIAVFGVVRIRALLKLIWDKDGSNDSNPATGGPGDVLTDHVDQSDPSSVGIRGQQGPSAPLAPGDAATIPARDEVGTSSRAATRASPREDVTPQ